jgi:hypothetical protein
MKKIYENETYKYIREWLDRDDKLPVNIERFVLAKQNDNTFERKFSDYLNYFQFLVSLKKLGQLKEKEIGFIFNYYLSILRKDQFITGYMKSKGYSELLKYLMNKK